MGEENVASEATVAAMGLLLMGTAVAQTAPPAPARPPTFSSSSTTLRAFCDSPFRCAKSVIASRTCTSPPRASNWALAAYMSKYMNIAMDPAKVTKPAEYKTWASFYSGTWQPVDKAIQAKDLKAFNEAYIDVIVACNGCHHAMGYGFIEIRT